MTIENFWVQINETTLRQGDYLPGCRVPIPVFDPTTFGKTSENQEVEIDLENYDLIVLTQSCDLENGKIIQVLLCPIFSIPEYEEANPAFKNKGVWNEVLKGRKEGLYLLASPTNPGNNREALVVDFRQIYSLPYDYVLKHATELGSRWRLKSPYIRTLFSGIRKIIYASWFTIFHSAFLVTE